MNNAFALPETPVQAALIPFVNAVLCDGLRVGLCTAFHPNVTSIVRELGGSWCFAHRAWVFSTAKFRDMVLPYLPDRVTRTGTHVLNADNFADHARQAYRARDTRIFTAHLDCQLIPLQSGGYFCQFNYDDVTVKALRRLDAVWHKPAGGWAINHVLERILGALARDAGIERDLIFVHDQIIELEALAEPPAIDIGISVPGQFPKGSGGDDSLLIGDGYIAAFGSLREKLDVDEDELKFAEINYKLYDFQVAGVRHLVGSTSALLADDMGLGKTRQAVVAARMAAGQHKVLIGCPASLRVNWAREIAMIYPEAKSAMVGEADAATLAEASWHIATYERLGTVVRDAATKYEVFVLDEAHYLKEHSANRTRNAFFLAQRIHRRFLLTGTPVLNRETEIHTLLRLSGHPIGNIPLLDFKNQYAGNATRRAELSERIAEWMLRRDKSVLKNLSGKSHQECYVMPSAGLTQYHNFMVDPIMPSIAKVTKLRQELERLKLEWIIETIESIPRDDKALVFCEYVDSVAYLKAALLERGITAVSLTGSDSSTARQKSVDRLQTDPTVRVFIGTTAAAGVGLTLTAACYVIFASLPWTPALKNQAEDRAYRNGQLKHVIVKIPLIPETIDEGIYELIAHKASVADDVMAGSNDLQRNIERVARTLKASMQAAMH
jgi:superfamily II DNA or RNA helicase